MFHAEKGHLFNSIDCKCTVRVARSTIEMQKDQKISFTTVLISVCTLNCTAADSALRLKKWLFILLCFHEFFRWRHHQIFLNSRKLISTFLILLTAKINKDFRFNSGFYSNMHFIMKKTIFYTKFVTSLLKICIQFMSKPIWVTPICQQKISYQL